MWNIRSINKEETKTINELKYDIIDCASKGKEKDQKIIKSGNR